MPASFPWTFPLPWTLCRYPGRPLEQVDNCEEEGSSSHPLEGEAREASGRGALDTNGFHSQGMAAEGNSHAPASNGGAHPFAVASGALAGGREGIGPGKGAGGTGGEARAVTVYDLVAATLDVASASPRRFFFEVSGGAGATGLLSLGRFSWLSAAVVQHCYFLLTVINGTLW